MMKFARKLCSLLLVVMMVMTVCPVTALAANQITTTTATVEKHFNQLKKMATDGKFFTTGDGSKPCHLNSHGSCWNTSGKTYCSVADVCQQRWLLNYVDYNVANANLLPGQFFPNGSAGGNSGNSCYGFANYAMWYIFSATSSSDMYKELSAKSTFTKDNITKLVQSGKLKKGYIIRSKDPNYSEMDAGHSIVFDKIDSGGNGIYVLDCNWNHNTVGNSKIQYHYVAFDTPYFKNMPIAVTKPGNVTVTSHTHDWSNTGLCSCGDKYGNWVKTQGGDKYQAVKGTLTPASGTALYVKQQPYKEPAGQYLAKVKSCDAVALLTNTIGNRWYEVKYTENGTDKTGYVYSGDAKFVKATNKLEAKCALAGKFNGKITEGTSLWAKNGDYSGSIASSDGVTKLTKVVFGIYNYSTGAATSARNVVTKTNIGSPKYAINSTDDTILFSSLSPGQYTFKIEGYADGTASASASFDFYVVSKTPPATSQITTTTATVEKHFNQLKKMATDGKFFTTGDGSKPCYLSNHRAEDCSSSSGKPCCNVVAVCTQNWLLNYVDYKPGSTSYLVKQYYPSGGTGNLGDSCFGFACYAMWYIYSTAGNQDIIGTLSTVSTYNKESVAKIVQQGQLKKGNIIRFSGGHSVIFDKIDPNGNGIYVLDCNWNNQSVGSSKIQYHIIDYNNSNYKGDKIAVTCAGNVTVADQPTTYTVSYNANGGGGAPSAQTKTKDVSLTLSTTRPTRAGYNFLGWATSSSATSAQYQPGSTYTANANITLYAVWEELNTIAINAANFPDANFRTVVSTFDKNGDGKLNEAEIAAVTMINCREKNISSLKGIEYFTALTALWCNDNKLTALDVSKNTALTVLNCGLNQLTALDVSRNTALTELRCGANRLTTLNVSNNTALTTLSCWGNQIATLDVSKNTALEDLDCTHNQLTILDVSKNVALERLDCCYNQLNTLDVSKNTALTKLQFGGNRLTSLDVSNNATLAELWCYENNLTSLDVSRNTALTALRCSNNHLTTLDISKNTALTELWCYESNLTSLDVSRNTALTDLRCSDNSYDITLNANRSYDLSKLPGSFDVSKAKAWNGCTIQGSVIKVNEGVNEVSYTYDCGNGKTMAVTLNVVGVEAPPATYTVRFNANGGYGSMAAVSNISGPYTLPSCTFEAPSGKQFKGWAVSPNGNVITGSSYNITADTTFYAVWEQQEVTGCCLEVGKTVATHGKEVLVPISISQNPGFAGINVKIDYDKTRLQLIGSDDTAGLNWTVNTGDNAGAVMVSTRNYTKDGEILLLKFKVLEDAPDGFAKVSLFNADVLSIDEKTVSVTLSSGGVEVITRLPGDVTGDGVIDTRDALRLKKHLAGMDAPIVWQNADVTGDNDVTLADLLRLMKYLAGMQVELV